MTCEVYMNYKFEGLSIKFYYSTAMLNPYATFTIQWQSRVLGHRLYGLKKQNYLLFGPLKKKMQISGIERVLDLCLYP